MTDQRLGIGQAARILQQMGKIVECSGILGMLGPVTRLYRPGIALGDWHGLRGFACV